MCVRDESRVCKMNGSEFEMRGEGGREVRPFGTYSTVRKRAKKKGKTPNGDYFI